MEILALTPPLPRTAPTTPPAAAAERVDIQSLPIDPHLEKLFRAPSVTAPDLSPDGRSLLYLSSNGGQQELTVMDIATQKTRVIKRFDRPVVAPEWTSDGKYIVYSQDRNGDEHTQIFSLKADGSKVIEMTANQGAIHKRGPISMKHNQMLYSSNKRDSRHFDVYSYDLKSGRSRMILKTKGDYTPILFSPDGTRVLVRKKSGNQNHDLYLLDPEARTLTHLTPHKGEVTFTNCRFSADGKTVSCLSNIGGEFDTPIKIDVATGTRTRINLDEPLTQWDVETYKRSGNWRVAVYNEDGISRMQIKHIGEKRVVDTSQVPEGVISDVEFTSDRKGVIFAFNGPTTPPSIWKLDLETAAAAPIVQLPIPGLDPSTLVKPRLVRYSSGDGREIPAFLYEPSDPKFAGRPFPAVVYLHGGPESQTKASFSPWIQHLVSRGYAVLAPNIRGSTGYGRTYAHLDDIEKRPDAIEGVAAAGRFLAADARFDRKRLAVMGGSYGGYMTMAQLAFHPELWAAGVEVVGMSSLKTFLQNTGAYRRPLREVEYGHLGRDDALLDRLSPLNHVDNIVAPLMLIQGKNDPRVPWTEAEQMARTLQSKGQVADYLLFEDEGHGLKKTTNRLKGYTAASNFLDEHL